MTKGRFAGPFSLSIMYLTNSVEWPAIVTGRTADDPEPYDKKERDAQAQDGHAAEKEKVSDIFDGSTSTSPNGSSSGV